MWLSEYLTGSGHFRLVTFAGLASLQLGDWGSGCRVLGSGFWVLGSGE
jgi:hypothetical protein